MKSLELYIHDIITHNGFLLWFFVIAHTLGSHSIWWHRQSTRFIFVTDKDQDSVVLWEWSCCIPFGLWRSWNWCETTQNASKAQGWAYHQWDHKVKVQSQDSVVNGKECGCPFTTFTALLASFLSLSYSFCFSCPCRHERCLIRYQHLAKEDLSRGWA